MKSPILAFLLTFLFAASVFANTRTWTNQDGIAIEAEHVSQADGHVMIRRADDNREFRIPIASLSQEDQNWLAAYDKPAGEGIYIAVGNGLHRMSSKDGRVWTNHEFVDKPGHNQNDLKDMAVGNGVCVVVGGFSKSNILTTSDGIEWNINDFNMGVLSGVVFTEGRFLAFGEGGKVGKSKDGKEWTIIKDATFPNTIATLRPDLYFSFQTYWKYTEDLQVSTDGGKTWESTEIPAPASVTNVIFAEGFPKF